ncbi:MAG: hypothetical protein IIB00_01815 [candidate division Zixibacteria bacterium]|nr:hypothetical protein [candidate division Zixibacteria bacterium]
MIGETYNNYKILEPLGEGGMARVYIAEDTRDGARVALKISRESVPFSRESAGWPAPLGWVSSSSII